MSTVKGPVTVANLGSGSRIGVSRRRRSLRRVSGNLGEYTLKQVLLFIRIMLSGLYLVLCLTWRVLGT